MENNSITKSDRQPRNAPLTAAKQTAIQHWKLQPEQSYVAIRPSTPRTMIEADTPNLWEIRNYTDHATAIGIIVIALIHTARLVNVENNLNETQIGEIANDVLEEYGYFKVEELKHVLKTAIRTKKIFGRLDYNVVMSWLEEYDRERTEEAMSISDCKAAHEGPPAPDVISWDEYVGQLRQFADSGDKEAQARLAEIEELNKRKSELLEAAKKAREKELAFLKFKHGEYLKNQK